MKLARTPDGPAFVPFLALVIAGVFTTELHANSFLKFLQANPQRNQDAKSATITRPKVSEDVCPLVPFTPVARDGHRGVGFLRKPPGAGSFPAILFIHGGMVERPAEN